jgi:hypothetical protein
MVAQNSKIYNKSQKKKPVKRTKKKKKKNQVGATVPSAIILMSHRKRCLKVSQFVNLVNSLIDGAQKAGQGFSQNSWST